MRWLLAVLLSTSLYSQDWEIHVPLLSHHLVSQHYWWEDKETFDPTCTGNWCRRLGTYTNFNPGVIIYKYHEDWKVGGGAFRNSLGELGFLMGGGYEYKKAGVEVGIASGYEKQTSMNNVIPMYSIYYRLWIFKFTLNHEIANVGLSVRF